MGNVRLLDCTLRDGGYVNDWEFGNSTIRAIFDRLCEANIDIIELGFLDDRRQFDMNRTIQPDTQSMMKVFGDIRKRNSMVVAMIDYGTCAIGNLQPKQDTFLDGIRLIFKKEKSRAAIEYAKLLQAKGYLVFLQMVSITSYSDQDMQEFIAEVNKMNPYAVSIVDTYGLMHKDEVLHYFKLLDAGLDRNIVIGYHAHNNFQLGYANAIEFITSESGHDKVVDGTLYGMGKSAGNDPLELVAMYMNDNLGKNYQMDQIMEAIDNNILEIYKKTYWGYSLLYYIAALNDCHPNYVRYLLEKNSLPIRSVNELLQSLPEEKKLHYDAALMESLYLDYQKNTIDDGSAAQQLKASLGGRPLLLIGPGKNIVRQKKRVTEYIKKYNPVVIPVNWIPDMDTEYIYIGNGKRYNLSYNYLSHYSGKLIGLSNTATTDEVPIDFVFNYDGAICHSENGDIEDDSLTTAISVLRRIGYRSLALAGFDGYKRMGESSYFSQSDILYEHIDGIYFNQRIGNRIAEFRKDMELFFITDSVYNDK